MNVLPVSGTRLRKRGRLLPGVTLLFLAPSAFLRSLCYYECTRTTEHPTFIASLRDADVAIGSWKSAEEATSYCWPNVALIPCWVMPSVKVVPTSWLCCTSEDLNTRYHNYKQTLAQYIELTYASRGKCFWVVTDMQLYQLIMLCILNTL